MKTNSPISLYKPNQGTLTSAIPEFATTFLLSKVYLRNKLSVSSSQETPRPECTDHHTVSRLGGKSLVYRQNRTEHTNGHTEWSVTLQ
jgi:hypothetical protein